MAILNRKLITKRENEKNLLQFGHLFNFLSTDGRIWAGTGFIDVNAEIEVYVLCLIFFVKMIKYIT